MRRLSSAIVLCFLTMPVAAQDPPTADECFALSGDAFLSCMQRRNNSLRANLQRRSSNDEDPTTDFERESAERALLLENMARDAREHRQEWLEEVEEIENLAAEQSDPPSAPWIPRISKSPLDDSTTVVFTLRSVDPVVVRFREPTHPELVIRCMENRVSVYISFGDIFMADTEDYGRIDYRIDDREARGRTLGASTDNNALGEWRAPQSIQWLRQMYGGETLFVRATPYNESRVSMRFEIAGIGEGIRPIREACDW